MKILKSEEYINGGRLNEGAGAGYEVVLDGLVAKKGTGKPEGEWVDYKPLYPGSEETERIRLFRMELEPCVLDKWSASGYYNGIASDSDNMFFEYGSEEDRKVDGGFFSGVVFYSDVAQFAGKDVVDDEDVARFLDDEFSGEFSVKFMYGRGWVHVDLTDPVKLGTLFEKTEDVAKAKREILDYEIGGTDYVAVTYAEVNAPNITGDVNFYFAHCDDEEFNESREVSEAFAGKPVYLNPRKVIDGIRGKMVNSLHSMLSSNGYDEGNPLAIEDVDNVASAYCNYLEVMVEHEGWPENVNKLDTDLMADIYDSVYRIISGS